LTQKIKDVQKVLCLKKIKKTLKTLNKNRDKYKKFSNQVNNSRVKLGPTVFVCITTFDSSGSSSDDNSNSIRSGFAPSLCLFLSNNFVGFVEL